MTGEFDGDFDECWAFYPRKEDRKDALRCYTARRREGISAETLLAATKNLAEARIGEDPKYTLLPATFFGPNERYLKYLVPGSEFVARSVPQLADRWSGD